MPRCPQCGKESPSLYITSSGVCVECNRKNYKENDGTESTGAPRPLLTFSQIYHNDAAKLLSGVPGGIEHLSDDEISKLVQLQTVENLKKIYKLLLYVLLIIPISLFLINLIF